MRKINLAVSNRIFAFTFFISVLSILGIGKSWGQVNITPIRTDVAGFTDWTDNDVAGTTYVQLLKATSVTISPAMNFDNYTSETLNFKARTYGGSNTVENTITVWISVNNGSSWTNIATVLPSSSTMTSQTQIDLSSYSGTQVKIKFSVAGTSNTIGAGIDDITISGNLVSGPEINIQENATNYLTGSTYAFGSIESGSSSAVKTFTIQNIGSSALAISGTPKVAISGTNAAEFTIDQTSTSASIAASGTTTFTITFSPSSVGAGKTATISIANDDSDENPYIINLTGNGSSSKNHSKLAKIID